MAKRGNKPMTQTIQATQMPVQNVAQPQAPAVSPQRVPPTVAPTPVEQQAAPVEAVAQPAVQAQPMVTQQPVPAVAPAPVEQPVAVEATQPATIVTEAAPVTGDATTAEPVEVVEPVLVEQEYSMSPDERDSTQEYLVLVQIGGAGDQEIWRPGSKIRLNDYQAALHLAAGNIMAIETTVLPTPIESGVIVHEGGA